MLDKITLSLEIWTTHRRSTFYMAIRACAARRGRDDTPQPVSRSSLDSLELEVWNYGGPSRGGGGGGS